MDIKRQKSNDIETLRGITILLVVVGHVIGTDANGGMKVTDNSLLRYLYCLLENIRMPLFTVISGWVYAFHPAKREFIFTFINKKIRRLLFPLLFVATTYFLLQYIIPGTNNKVELSSIWRIYVYPYTIYWYLPALFIVFICVAICDTLNWLTTIQKWLIGILITMSLCFSELHHIIPISTPNFFAFKNALYLSPFFLLGVGLNRFKEITGTAHMKQIYLIGLILGVALQQLHSAYPAETSFYKSLHLSIPIGMISAAYLINQHMKMKAFIWLAQYAYTIYLFHGFGTSGGRIILTSIGIHNKVVILMFATAIALFGSILIEKVLINWKVTRLLFLGKK